jgi:hypothetical protein
MLAIKPLRTFIFVCLLSNDVKVSQYIQRDLSLHPLLPAI